MSRAAVSKQAVGLGRGLVVPLLSPEYTSSWKNLSLTVNPRSFGVCLAEGRRTRGRHADMLQHIREGILAWKMLKWNVSYHRESVVKTLIRL